MDNAVKNAVKTETSCETLDEDDNFGAIFGNIIAALKKIETLPYNSSTNVKHMKANRRFANEFATIKRNLRRDQHLFEAKLVEYKKEKKF